MKKNKLFICLLFVVLVIMLFVSCGGSAGKLPSRGEEFTPNTECLSAISESAFNELNRVCNRRDEAELVRMMGRGEVYVLSTYEKVIMVDSGFSKSKVKFEKYNVYTNTSNYVEVYVSNEFLYQ